MRGPRFISFGRERRSKGVRRVRVSKVWSHHEGPRFNVLSKGWHGEGRGVGCGRVSDCRTDRDKCTGCCRGGGQDGMQVIETDGKCGVM